MKWFSTLLLLSAAAASLGLWATKDRWTGLPSQEQLINAQDALTRGQYGEAERLALQLADSGPNTSKAFLIAGEAATKLQRYDNALQYYARIPQDGSSDSLIALLASGELLLQKGQFAKAEEFYRRVLNFAPKHSLAHDRLAMILGMTGRRWESVPHLLELIKQNEFTLQHLVYLGSVENVIDSAAELRRLADPNDPLAPLGLARVDLLYNRDEKAKVALKKVVAGDRHQSEAQVCLGKILVENASEQEFLDWHAQLPETVDAHPELWVVRGFWLKARGKLRAATRCFWEAVSRAPNHQVANYQLGQVLVSLGERARAEPFLDRHRRLDELARTLEDINGRPLSPNLVPQMHQIARLLQSLGRLWEASAWYQTIVAVRPDLTSARQVWNRLQAELAKTAPPRTLPSANPARQVNLSSYPLPHWRVPDKQIPTGSTHAQPNVPIRFENLAESAGIDFTYVRGSSPDREGHRIVDTTGGGVAILDYDGDGWPDIYLTQGRQSTDSPEQQPIHTNRLFRNLGSGRFEDVTAVAGVGDTGYGQGVTVGDYNDDGFPDLYVANLGGNRLLRNCGDGTFTDATEVAGLAGKRWTTSSLLADFNGDGFPDIYDVNYLAGNDISTRLCQSRSGMRVCSPSQFDAEQDQVYLNQGNGQFENVTVDAGIVVPEGKGLGIVAADFRGTGLLDLFIANDQVANFYFRNESGKGTSSLKFSEQARPLGLAYDRDGKTQACMGVAVADSNQDGLLDLFATNFHDESNTLYLQHAAGGFLDGTRSTGLRDPGFSMLGFGTQFLDADLDGFPDLVVTNGHVDDFRKGRGIPYHMPPQVFRNVGGGRFEEISAQQAGTFFEKAYLGRGLARVDWNRDGREDFVVSHLDAPAALVTNQTNPTGHFLAVKLVGSTSSRDAIGTTVIAKFRDQTRMQQLTAGDGYQASNQRQLVFGLGSAQVIQEIQIRWPSGKEQIFHQLPVNKELMIIEGHDRMFPLDAF